MRTILNCSEVQVPIVIPTGFFQMTIGFDGPTRSGKAATVLGFTIGGSIDLYASADLVLAAWIEHMLPLQHEAFILARARAVTATDAYEPILTPQEGSRTGDLSPPNVACLVRKQTSGRGRYAQGRMFLPGVLNDGDVYDDGTLNPTRVASIQAGLAGLDADPSADGVNGVVLHNDGAHTPTSVTQYLCQTRVATQRRRLR